MSTISTPSLTRPKRDRIVVSSLKKNCSGKTFSATVLSLTLASLGTAAVAGTNSTQHPTIEQSQGHSSSGDWKDKAYDTLNSLTRGRPGTAIGTIASMSITYYLTQAVQNYRNPIPAAGGDGQGNNANAVPDGPPRITAAGVASLITGTAYITGSAIYQYSASANVQNAPGEIPQTGQDTSAQKPPADDTTDKNPITEYIPEKLASNSDSTQGSPSKKDEVTSPDQTLLQSDSSISGADNDSSETHPDDKSIRDNAASAVKNAKNAVKDAKDTVKDVFEDTKHTVEDAVKRVAENVASRLTDDESQPGTGTSTSTEEDGQETTTPNTDSQHFAESGQSDAETPDSEQNLLSELMQELASMLNESLSITNTAIRPAAGSYMSNAWAANTMFQMNLNDRLGSYYQGEASPHQGSAWIRYSGSRGHLKDTSGELRTAGDKSTVMMGVDMLAQSSDARDQFTVGIMGGYGHYSGHTKSNSFDYSTKGKVNGYSVGLYGTYQKDVATQHGFYADSWLLWNQFDNRVKGGDLPAEKYDSKGMTASLELGYNIPLSDRNNVKYVLQPHAQVMYQNVRSENFRQADNTSVDFLNRSRVQTALGIRAAAHITTGLTSVITPHFEANWLHANKGYGVNIDNVQSNMNSGRNIGQVKLGVQGDMNRRVSLNIELFHNQGNAGYHETGGNVVAKYRF